MDDHPQLEAVARELARAFAWTRWRWLREAVTTRAGDEGRTVREVLLDSAQAAVYLAVYDAPDAPAAEFRRRVFVHMETDFRGYELRGRTAEFVPIEAVA